MKLYLIMKGDYEDRHICDIVTDKEKAKKLKEFYSYFSQCSDNSWTPDSEEAYIVEEETDMTNMEVIDELLASRKDEYVVYLTDNGEFHSIAPIKFGVFDKYEFNIQYYPVTLNRKTPYYSATVCANSEEEAKDIAIKLYKKYQTEVFS